MPLVDLIEQALLDHLWTDPAFTPTTTVHLGLSTTTPTDAGGNVTEPTLGAYARQPCQAAQMGAAAGTAPAVKSNTSIIAFPQATSGGPQTVTHVVIFSLLTAGTVYGWAPLTTSRVINTGDTASFAVGAFVWQVGKGTPG